MQFCDEIRVGEKLIGKGLRPFIIAEAGVAHFGDYQKALKLIDLAYLANADAVKFQTFIPDEMVSRTDKEWHERMQSRALELDDFRKLKEYADSKGIIFFSTAHDQKSFEYLESINVELHKIGSGEVGNWDYIRRVASAQKPVILSTGMYTDKDIQRVIKIFEQVENDQLCILHCITNYPCPANEISLNEIRRINEKYKVMTGYSDHSQGFHIPLASVALGAVVIEKHISLDFNIPNAQDWKVSCGIHDLGTFVSQVHDVADAMSDLKVRTNAEIENKKWASKSIVASMDLEIGQILSDEHLAVKRPGCGIEPDKKLKLLGRKLVRPIAKDQLLQWEDFSEA